MKTCPYCHAEIYPDSVRCPTCGRDLQDLKYMSCSHCGRRKDNLSFINNILLCQECTVELAGKSVIITTTSTLEGYQVTRYIDVETVEVVLGGKITTLQDARYAALQLLKVSAFTQDAAAVIGIDLDYTQVGAQVLLVASGTLVQAVKT